MKNKSNAAATRLQPRPHQDGNRFSASRADVLTRRGKAKNAPAVRSGAFPIVGIGASAGGLDAFTQLLSHLPSDTGMAFVLVQHLSPDHESALPQILSRTTTMPVSEVTKRTRVEPNHIYVIPPNRELGYARGTLSLQPRPVKRAAHHPIDFFFESLAQDQHERAIGVILSGTASDGTVGLEAIKAEGGITFVQDESAKYDSMPRSAVAAGCVDFVLAPPEIARELARLAKHPYWRGQTSSFSSKGLASRAVDTSKPSLSGTAGRREESASTKILSLLRNHAGVDFAVYKPNTIHRRISRRMLLGKFETLEAYTASLSDNSKELGALHTDLLIGVTSFFRNPEAFEALTGKAFPAILKRRTDTAIRLWVLGCSTGQEAYSLAMALIEYAEKITGSIPPIQVYATDVNEAALNKARHGLYLKTVVADVSPERLRRFFVEEEGGYRVTKMLRDMCVFAQHNLIADPSFSRLDLISCRNLLIYLEPELQKQIMPLFHYALKPDGVLFLGASESVGEFTDLFEPLDKKQKIYVRQPVSTPAFRLHFSPRHPAALKAGSEARPALPARALPPDLSAQREADRVALKRHAPPAVLVNANFQVVQFRGVTGPYLEPSPGIAAFSLLQMAREGLMLPLRAALNQARKENRPVRRSGLNVRFGDQTQCITIEVEPLKNLRQQYYLISFEEPKIRGATQDGAESPGVSKPNKSDQVTAQTPATSRQESRRNSALERELAETRDYLQSLQEQHEAATEEIQATSEEVQSANEELQSINEEMETSKEELESSNEELLTVNEEMAHRNTQLNRLNSDLNNLHLSINTAIVVLGRDLTIRRFTPHAETTFKLTAADLGRPLTAIKASPGFGGMEPFVTEVIDAIAMREREVQDDTGRWYLLRARPYVTLDNKIDGAVLVWVDIDALKQTEHALERSRDYSDAILRATRDPLVVLRADLRVDNANPAFYELFETTPAETDGRLLYELGRQQWDIPKLRALLTNVLSQGSAFNDFEVEVGIREKGLRTLLLNGRQIMGGGAKSPELILLSIEDITERLKTRAALRASEIRFRRLFETAKDGILLLDPNTRKITDANPLIVGLLGYERNELVGKELFQIGLLPDEAASQAAFRELQEKRFIRYEDLPLRTKSGARCEVEFVSNLYVEDGNEAIQCNIRDITERSRAEEALRASERRFRFMAESMPQKIFTADPGGEMDYLNQQWMQFTGLTFEEMRGSGWKQFVHPADLQENVRIWGQFVASNQPFQFQHRFRRHDGVYRWHVSRAHAMLDVKGNVLTRIGSTTDIDDQIRAEEKLEVTVAERTAELRETIGELAAFSYSVSHDMRAPLRALRGFSDIVVEENASQLNARGLTYLKRISTAAERMDNLIEDVLSYQRVLRAEVNLEPVDLDQLVRQIVASYPQLQTNEANIHIKETLPSVIGNEASLSQCVSNLLSNAVKFVAPGVRPMVEVWAQDLGADIRLSIRDNGIGISPQNHQRIFGIFERVVDRETYEGTGIGLAIVRKAVERMNGRFGLVSALGQGSTFWIELRKNISR